MVRLLVALLMLVGAVGAVVLTDEARTRADFTFINRGDVSTLDPQKMTWMQDLRIARAIFEGLVKTDIYSRGYDLLPGVAERWEISPDGRTYTFHLRADARWSNGAPVTAHDFVFSWRRAMVPDTACDYTAMYQIIRGAKAFYDWRQARLGEFRPGVDDAAALWDLTRRKFDEMVALRAPDDRTLEFELIRPTPYFLDLCALAVFYPVYPPLVSRYERVDPATGRVDAQSGWTKAGINVSNGPFVLSRWRFKRDLRMERNPFYWDSQRIAIDSILMPCVEDPNAQVLAFRSGAVDWVSEAGPDYRADMLEQKHQFYREHQAQYDALVALGLDPIEIDRRLPPDPRNRVHAFPGFGTYFYNFNCQEKLADGRDNPFHDARVRRAFCMAVDKRRIADQVRRVGERPATALIPPGSLKGYRSPQGLAYDPAAARALLAEAGYPGGRGFITVEILFNLEGGHDRIAQAVKKDWEENLGITVTLAQREIKVFRNDLKHQNFIVSRAAWYGDYGDPCTFLDISRKDDGNNDRRYASPRFEALMASADDERDPERRMRTLEAAESLLMDEDVPMCPLFHYVEVQLFDPHRITGISSHPRQDQNVHWIDVLGDGKGPDRPRMLPPEPPAPVASAGPPE